MPSPFSCCAARNYPLRSPLEIRCGATFWCSGQHNDLRNWNKTCVQRIQSALSTVFVISARNMALIQNGGCMLGMDEDYVADNEVGLSTSSKRGRGVHGHVGRVPTLLRAKISDNSINEPAHPWTLEK
eukprot:1157936-Pelagomonas_calceolata.AAC.8